MRSDVTTVMFLRSSNGDNMEDRSGWGTAKGRNWRLPRGWRTGISCRQGAEASFFMSPGPNSSQFPQSNGTLPVAMRESHNTPAAW